MFVPFVLPGERWRWSRWSRRRNLCGARVERILQAAPERMAARCPHFGVCGGCDYQHISYEAQLKFKSEILRETLRRIGRIEWAGRSRRTSRLPGDIAIGRSGKCVRWKMRATQGLEMARTAWPKLGHRIFSREFDGALRGGRLLDYFAAAAEDAACACARRWPPEHLPRGLREIEAFVDAADTQAAADRDVRGIPFAGGASTRKLFGAWCRRLPVCCFMIRATTGWNCMGRDFWSMRREEFLIAWDIFHFFR